jgi:hypothetical protein
MLNELRVIPHDPAFPQEYKDCESFMRGMSLRDYFAAKAISFIQWNHDNNAICAKKCYEIADAMLEARK